MFTSLNTKPRMTRMNTKKISHINVWNTNYKKLFVKISVLFVVKKSYSNPLLSMFLSFMTFK